jgi:hypothetical protein
MREVVGGRGAAGKTAAGNSKAAKQQQQHSSGYCTLDSNCASVLPVAPRASPRDQTSCVCSYKVEGVPKASSALQSNSCTDRSADPNYRLNTLYVIGYNCNNEASCITEPKSICGLLSRAKMTLGQRSRAVPAKNKGNGALLIVQLKERRSKRPPKLQHLTRRCCLRRRRQPRPAVRWRPSLPTAIQLHRCTPGRPPSCYSYQPHSSPPDAQLPTETAAAAPSPLPQTSCSPRGARACAWRAAGRCSAPTNRHS